MTDQDQEIEYIPFHAINEFMRADYRLQVVRSALNALPALPATQRTRLDRLTRWSVTVPGFRNSAKAPVSLRVRPTADAFEKNPPMVAIILEIWAELHSTLRQQVVDLLIERKWDIPTLDIDQTELPGFQISWPTGEGFDVINEAFRQKYPETSENDDDISLMTVWVSGRLPYQVDAEPDLKE